MALAVALPPWLGKLAMGPIRWAAIVLFCAGMALGFASRRALGKSFTPFPKPVDDGAHVSRGPYRFVRHPMYSAIIVSAGGWALLWGSVAGAVATIALLVLFDLKARREEALLAQSYPSYGDYKRRTRKLIPFVY